ncbi:MAG: GntR family transcriptional regulator [candidate division WOR-3 bacterium]
MRLPSRYKIYRALKERIITLQLRPGDKISEIAIAKQFKTSRTPVREALLMLENEKLVVCDNSFGFMVRKLTSKDIEEYFAVREVIEDFVLSLLVKTVTEKDLEKLEKNVQKAEKVVLEGDIKEIIRCETEFHEIMYRAARSHVLFETISSLVDKFQWIRGIALSVPGSPSNSLDQHKKILELLRKRDLRGLKKLMKEHLREAKTRVEHFQKMLL